METLQPISVWEEKARSIKSSRAKLRKYLGNFLFHGYLWMIKPITKKQRECEREREFEEKSSINKFYFSSISSQNTMW
jgi:hypothetical protein